MVDMFASIYPVLEDAPVDAPRPQNPGVSLAKIVETHPDLDDLLDFFSPDPVEMAYEIGMVHPQEEDSADDLAEIDFGAWEWHEASTGIAVIERALTALRADPSSISRHLYDPALSQDDVIADLESMLLILEDARDREVRFRLHADGQRGLWPQPNR